MRPQKSPHKQRIRHRRCGARSPQPHAAQAEVPRRCRSFFLLFCLIPSSQALALQNACQHQGHNHCAKDPQCPSSMPRPGVIGRVPLALEQNLVGGRFPCRVSASSSITWGHLSPQGCCKACSAEKGFGTSLRPLPLQRSPHFAAPDSARR